MPEPEPEIIVPGHPREATEAVNQPAKLLRIASIIRELLEDVRQSAPDEAGRERLREIYERARAALKESLSDDLAGCPPALENAGPGNTCDDSTLPQALHVPLDT